MTDHRSAQEGRQGGSSDKLPGGGSPRAERSEHRGRPSKGRTVRPNPGLVEAARVQQRLDELGSQCQACGRPFAWVHNELTGGGFCRFCGQRAESSNTALSTLQSGPPSNPEKRTGGVDWLSLTCQGEWVPDVHAKLLERLMVAQAAARESEDERHFVQLGAFTAEVKPTGAGRGYGYCPILLTVQGMSVRIADRASSAPLGPEGKPVANLYVDVPSMVLMDRGEAGVMDDLRELFAALSYRATDLKPSRVDVAADIPGVSMREVLAAFNGERIVSRTRDYSIHGKRSGTGQNAQTLTLGAKGADCLCRIYDKLAEVQDQPAKQELMIKRRWGGELPECAVRVEFQLRREALLNQHKIDSVDDLWAKLRDLCDWLVLSWLRFTAHEVKREHTERTLISDMWRSVMEAFRAWTGSVREYRCKRERLLPNVAALYRQAEGCLTSVLAGLASFPETAVELVTPFFEFLQKRADGWEREILRKRLEFEARTTDLPGMWRLSARVSSG